MKGSQAKEGGCRNNEYICIGKEMHFALLLQFYIFQCVLNEVMPH